MLLHNLFKASVACTVQNASNPILICFCFKFVILSMGSELLLKECGSYDRKMRNRKFE